jgi:hypothetical protein
MKKNYIAYLFALALFSSSCSDEDKTEAKENESGIVNNSWNYVKSGFKNEEDRTIEDSLKLIKLENHANNLKTKFPEYRRVAKWFASKPKQLRGQVGNLYKIQNGVIQEGKTITRKELSEISENYSYLYFYETEDVYYIVELQVVGNKVECANLRSIDRGMIAQPMYDYVFDEEGKTKQEIYQGDVNSSLYDEDGRLYFEFSKKVNGVELINKIDLGNTLEI